MTSQSRSPSGGGSSSSFKSAVPAFSGLLAGCTSTFLLYPLELIKVRLQVNESYKGGGVGSKQFRTELRTIMNLSGGRGFMKLRGLYNGLGPSLVGNGVSWGGYFYVYENVKSRMAVDKELSSVDYIGAAAVSGATMVMLTNPIWLIKTRIQLQLPTAGEANYTGVFDAATRIVKDEGFFALYKGVVPALMLVSHGMVQFGVYENLKKAFPSYAALKKSTDKQVSVVERLVDSSGYLAFGALSKMIASTVTYPVQVVKSRLQQRQDAAFEIVKDAGGEAGGEIKRVRRNYTTVLGTVTRIMRKEGVAGFFKGSLANAARVAPNA
eukprot:CAMPEP_0197547628 /NCGR_PEP_ID=MMETSP1320-20131121/1942_1 /TAXON_ID=91990 /ORGANISM="Bolidomonas sp., Strain RCC2347" /LENGTH=323 /DNA_ID=CAMNT_0043107471 /DNA_START=157 /DNA_END=1125 /DNA_ORIENTATION=-